MNPDTTTIAAFAAVLVMSATTGTLAFLAKRAFNDTTEAVKSMAAKLDVITAAQARGDGDLRVLAAELRAELKALRERIDRLERVQQEIAG